MNKTLIEFRVPRWLPKSYEHDVKLAQVVHKLVQIELKLAQVSVSDAILDAQDLKI